jgi:putative transposase
MVANMTPGQPGSGSIVASDLSRWMHWQMTAHVRRYLGHYRSSGHVWQGRFKAFPVEEDEHLLAVLRYMERNPLRAGLVGRAEEWSWSSLRWLSASAQSPVRLEPGTVPRGTLGAEGVNAVTGDIDLEAIRESVRRDRPFGTSGWTIETAKALNLEYSLRPRGRPRRDEPGANGGNT